MLSTAIIQGCQSLSVLAVRLEVEAKKEVCMEKNEVIEHNCGIRAKYCERLGSYTVYYCPKCKTEFKVIDD